MDDNNHDEARSRREAQDEIVIEALATGRSYSEAGELAGCSGRTVARRMEDPVFARRVADRRGERVVSVAGQLTSLGSEAVEVIRASMHCDTESIRLSAAKTLLDMAVKFRSAHDLEVEIAEIRRHLEMEG